MSTLLYPQKEKRNQQQRRLKKTIGEGDTSKSLKGPVAVREVFNYIVACFPSLLRGDGVVLAIFLVGFCIWS